MSLLLSTHRSLCRCRLLTGPLHSERLVIAAAKKQEKKKRKPKRKVPVEQLIGFDDGAYDIDDDGEYQVETIQGGLAMPSAPSPSTKPRREEEEGPVYPVFAPKPSNIQKVQGAWSWDDEGEGGSAASSGPPLPEWNPRTGFMRSAADVQAMASTSAPSAQQHQPADDSVSVFSQLPQQQARPLPPPPDVQVTGALLSPVAAATDPSGDLPPVSAGQILTSCIGTSFWMTVIAMFLRAYAQANAPATLGTDPRLLAELLRFPSGLDSWENVGLAIGTVVLVTGARLQLMKVWPEFRSATNRSNKQILEPLNWLEIALVAALTGVSEELLFRGAIIPASFPDWRGALLAGVIFGVLHNSGGRNLSFAAWASGVGIMYGGLFVVTHNIWVPATAHALANFCSAAAWKTKNAPSDDEP